MRDNENDEVTETRARIRNKTRHAGNIAQVFFGSVFDHPNPTQEAIKQAGVTSRAMEVTAGWALRQRTRAAYFMGLMKALEATANYGRDQFAEVQEGALTDIVGPDFVTDEEGETLVATKQTEVHLAETQPEQPLSAREREDLS